MWIQRTFAAFVVTGALIASASAQAETADAFVQKVAGDVIDAVKGDKAIQAGNIGRINALVDTKVMPFVDFQRMTALSAGRYWKQATPDQQQRLGVEFKTLLVRTYAGALTQVKSQTTVTLKPFRSAPTDTEVIVRTAVNTDAGDPVELDYRLEKTGESWRVYDINVGGIWLVEQYRNSFAQEIGANGVDGLISKLAEKNKTLSAAPVKS